MNFKQILKKFLPVIFLKKFRPIYHGAISLFANYFFGCPSNKIIIFGVTGTNGKTTTVNLIAKILESAGYKVGLSSTINFKFGNNEIPNTVKMTMPSGWWLQKSLAKMVKIGCQYAVLEISSEGLAQNRHLGINFDYAIFTNLTPEHIDSHGNFEKYKMAKAKLFKALSVHEVTKEKKLINSALKKTIVTNLDDSSSKYFISFPAHQKVSFACKNSSANFVASNIHYDKNGISFQTKNVIFNLQLKGQFDVYNALAAIVTTNSLGVELDIIKCALEGVSVVPGRMEIIQSEPFIILVDYAYEPEEMKQLYETIDRWKYNSIIQILGPTGGGRDKARIKVLGNMAGAKAKLVFVTTDDPYDDDPSMLADQMAVGVMESGKKKNIDFFIELDRRSAIHKAIAAAKAGDIVLITGKGADQKMCLANGKNIDWDDRAVARSELAKSIKHKAHNP